MEHVCVCVCVSAGVSTSNIHDFYSCSDNNTCIIHDLLLSYAYIVWIVSYG